MASSTQHGHAATPLGDASAKKWIPEVYVSSETLQMELESYSIPKLPCAQPEFPKFQHPLGHTLRGRVERWLALHGLDSFLGSEKKVQKLLDHEPWQWVTRTHWDANPTRLKWVACLYTFFCALDDFLAENHFRDCVPYVLEMEMVMMWTHPKAGRELATETIDFFDDPELQTMAAEFFNDVLAKAETQPGTEYQGQSTMTPMGSAFLELWSQASGDSPEDWGICFMTECHKFLLAFLTEAHTRHQQSLPSIPDYIKQRRITGSLTYLLGSCNGYISKLYMPTNILHSPKVEKILDHCSDITNWLNDIYSLPKELPDGDVHNLVLLISIHQKCSLNDAAQRVADMIEEKCEEMLELNAKEENETPSEHQAAIDNLIEKCFYHVRAVFEIHRFNPRYRSSARTKSESKFLEIYGR